jgi:hypothetical protein
LRADINSVATTTSTPVMDVVIVVIDEGVADQNSLFPRHPS